MINSNSIAAFQAPEPAILAPFFPGYEIDSLIATGGMGAVYKALQLSLDRPVAIKILRPEFGQDASFRANFEAEAKAMARLNHPSLIGVYDFGEVAGMLFIIMEFVQGQTLYHSAHGLAIATDTAANIVAGICLGLAHAHENGILHRDIKPGNILLDPHAQPKIGDFGLARPIDAAHEAGEAIFGTPHYTAPEVLQYPHQVDARADIFSVGVVLHELLTGRLPASDLRPASVICGCDARFDAIIRRATHPLPDLRYSSAADMAKDLHVFCAGVPTSAAATAKTVGPRGPSAARPIPASQPAKGPTRKSSGNTATMLCLGVAVVAAVAYLGFSRAFHTNTPATIPLTAPASPPPQRSTPPPAVMDHPSEPTHTVPLPVPAAAHIEPVASAPEVLAANTPAVAPEPEPQPTPPAPTFDVPGFLDHARDVMRQKASPFVTASQKGIEGNYNEFERQITYRVHLLDKYRKVTIGALVDAAFEKWRAAGKRLPSDLDLLEGKPDTPTPRGSSGHSGDPERDFYDKVTGIHAKFLAKQVVLEHDLDASLLKLASSYIFGLTKQIERLTAPNAAPAVALLRAEISETQNRPLYFANLMRGINPNAPQPPPVEPTAPAEN